METPEDLRQRLRNERNITISSTTNSDERSGDSGPVSGSSADHERYVPDSIATNERTEPSVSGLHNGVRRTKRTASNTERKLSDLAGSLAQINQRERSKPRRLGKDNSQNWADGTNVPTGSHSSSTSTTVRAIGNLITDEPIPERFFEPENERARETEATKPETKTNAPAAKRSKPAKPGNSGIIRELPPELESLPAKRKFFSSSATLSKQEAKDLQEPLRAALTDELEILDKMIWKLVGDELEQPIWSDISDKEMSTLTDMLLKLGQKSPTVATVSRVAVDGSDYIIAGTVVLPRMKQTVDVIRQARKKQKQDATETRREKLYRLRRNLE